MKTTELYGKFLKVAQGEGYIIVGLLAPLSSETLTYEEIRYRIAPFYGILPDNPRFAYRFITKEGAREKGCKFPVNDYNAFLEILK